jgi:pimeloyl-ACP methyl ester carboxylesterase
VIAKSRFVTANRLRQHLLEWGDGRRVVLLLHGYLEHAHVWDLVAPRLVRAGYHAFALDWRGHGDSEWIGAGGYYHFADYAADLAFLVRQLGGRAAIVAHSMGATAAMLYAGTEPDRVTALALIDGVGPPDLSGPAAQPARWAKWIADLERTAERDPRTMTLDDAKTRLRERFPRFSPNVTRLMAEHGTRARSGQRTWKFDPLHQTLSPVGFSRAAALAFAARVTAPVLFVEGSESPVRLEPDDLAERLAALRATRAVIADSGHHPHLEQPDALADTLIAFLDEHDA